MLIILGSGGHAKVVLDALIVGGFSPDDICVRDDAAKREGQLLLGVRIRNPAITSELSGENFHVAIGMAPVRERLCRGAEEMGALAITVLHPGATVSASAEVGTGSFVGARAVIGPDARCGRGAIVNHGAVVDHDCIVGDFCHIAPNATLGGGAMVGDRTLVGAGATVLPGIRIGSDVTVGAGAVVTHDIPAGERWAGAPARKLGVSGVD